MGTLMINNCELQIKEWNGDRVVMFSDIDRVHGRKEGTAKARFHSNRKHFIEGVDFHKASRKDFNNEFGTKNVLKGNPNLPMILLTKTGYLMIVKSLHDDKAWEIQRQLITAYFMLEMIVEETKNEMVVPESMPLENELRSFLEHQTKVLEAEAKRNDEFRETMMKSFQTMANIIVHQADMIQNFLNPSKPVAVQPVIPEKKVATKKSEPVNEYKVWKDKIYGLISGYDKSKVLSETYKYMQRKYGVCWEQEEKDYIAKYEKKPSNTLSLIYWMEREKPSAYRNLFQSCLMTVLAYTPKEEVKVVYPVKNGREIKAMVDYIAEKTGNNSPYGTSIYRNFFIFFPELNEVDWGKLEEKYRKANHMNKGNRVSKVSMMYLDPELEQKCAEAFNAFVTKKYATIINGL